MKWKHIKRGHWVCEGWELTKVPETHYWEIRHNGIHRGAGYGLDDAKAAAERLESEAKP